MRSTASAFVAQARALAAQERFDEAMQKLDYALQLNPQMVEFLLAKADILACRTRLPEAAAAYRAAEQAGDPRSRVDCNAGCTSDWPR